MGSKLTFMKNWYDAIIEDEYVETSPQEMAYILYAAANYAFFGERIDIGKIFGENFKGLNRSMPTIYSQIDNIKEFGERNQGKNQKYDNDKVRELAAMGLTQKDICKELGYDVDKSKSLSSNKGYKEGVALYKKSLSEDNSHPVASFNTKLSKTVKVDESPMEKFDF